MEPVHSWAVGGHALDPLVPSQLAPLQYLFLFVKNQVGQSWLSGSPLRWSEACWRGFRGVAPWCSWINSVQGAPVAARLASPHLPGLLSSGTSDLGRALGSESSGSSGTPPAAGVFSLPTPHRLLSRWAHCPPGPQVPPSFLPNLWVAYPVFTCPGPLLSSRYVCWLTAINCFFTNVMTSLSSVHWYLPVPLSCLLVAIYLLDHWGLRGGCSARWGGSNGDLSWFSGLP